MGNNVSDAMACNNAEREEREREREKKKKMNDSIVIIPLITVFVPFLEEDFSKAASFSKQTLWGWNVAFEIIGLSISSFMI